MALSLIDEFESLMSGLENAGIDYAVVGAMALAVWGAPRATKDIDILARAEDTDAILNVAAQRGFKLRALPMTFRDGMSVQRVTKIVEGDALTLDILVVNPNLEPVWGTRHTVKTQQGAFKVISRDALIQMKLAANRPQDLADVERLQDADR